MKRTISFFTLSILFVSAVTCLAQSNTGTAGSVEKAQMLLRFDLKNEAKNELINVLFSNAKTDDKANSLYLLGTIAFTENKIKLASDTWKELIAKYPNSSQAKSVINHINALAQVITEAAETSVDNAVAQLYLSRGNFWSRGKDSKWVIDSSWIPHVEVAIKWYDKVITDFPKSDAARIAFKEKMKTLLGWKESGQYGESYGIKKSFSTYMPLLLKTFEEFEVAFPEDSMLQPLRYQIAQAYWSNKNWSKTREWLNIIIEKSSDSYDFYKDLANWRLQKIEY